MYFTAAPATEHQGEITAGRGALTAVGPIPAWHYRSPSFGVGRVRSRGQYLGRTPAHGSLLSGRRDGGFDGLGDLTLGHGYVPDGVFALPVRRDGAARGPARLLCGILRFVDESLLQC